MPIVVSDAAVRFARQVGEAGLGPLLDIHCGLHSGIPECCVFFFVKVWSRWGQGRERDRRYAEYHAFLRGALGGRHPGYVLCPACVLRRHVVAVRRCGCHRQRTARVGGRTVRLPWDRAE